jgi:DNA-binding MarR family transcriptional regulator
MARASPGEATEELLVRVNFTPGDVARTRFTLTPAPMWDTTEALIGLRRAAASGWRDRGRAAPWLREARRAFPATARPLLDLIGPQGPWPGVFDRFTPDLLEGLEELRAVPRARLRASLEGCPAHGGRPPLWVRNLADGDREQLELVIRAIRDLHDAVVAPHRNGALAAAHADLARRIPVLVTGGQEALLGTLHPRLRWRDEGLERTGIDFEMSLEGRGLLLRPSAFWTGEPLFSFDEEGCRPHVLIYAAQPNGHSASGNGTASDLAAQDSLAALLGPTRAAVLRALREPRGTAELAAAVQISPASASEHAKTLRDASLIETRREGRGVRHSLTALGAAMAGTDLRG